MHMDRQDGSAVKALASKPDNVGSVLGTHMVEEEKNDPRQLSFDLHKRAVAHPLRRNDKWNQQFSRTVVTEKQFPE